jgi:predicted RND superfamily exporter protein
MTRSWSFCDALADWIVQHGRCCLVVATVITCCALTQLHRLQFDDDFRNLFRTTDASANVITAIQNDLTCLVMIDGSPLITPEGLSVMYDVRQALEDKSAVAKITSMLDARQPRRVGKYFLPHFPGADADAERMARAVAETAGHPLLDGQLLSTDQQSTLMFVQLDPALTTRAEIRDAVDAVRSTLTTSLEGTKFRFELSGLPVIRMALANVFTRDQAMFNVGAATVAMIVSAIAYRSAYATLVILLGPMLGVLWSMAAVAWIGEPLSIVNGMIAPLTMAIGLTAAVHMMHHYRRRRQTGATASEAVHSMLQVVAPACGWAALTTMLGFLTLGAARLETVRHFGFLCAMAVALTFLAVLITLPALCSLLRLNFAKSTVANDGDSWLASKLCHVTRRVLMHPARYCVWGSLLTLGMLAVATQLKPAIGISEALPSTGDTTTALQAMEARFGGVLPITLVVQWPESTTGAQVLDAIGAAHTALEGQSFFSQPLSLVSLLQSLPGDSRREQFSELRYVPPEIVTQFFDSGARQSYVLVRSRDVGTHQLEPVIQQLDQQLAELTSAHPGFRFELTEVIVESVRVGNSMISDLARSLLLAVPLIALVMILVFRSWRLGLVSMLPNVFPLAATAACIVLFGWHLRLFTVSLFAIFFGIAVDDTIHIMLRFQREYQRGVSAREAILESMRHVGPAVVTTTIVLSAGISVLMVSQIFGIRRFGILFCCGLCWALVGDLILLPAALGWWYSASENQERPSQGS